MNLYVSVELSNTVDASLYNLYLPIYVHVFMSARRGGGARGGTCPHRKFKNMGAPKDNLTRKKLKKKLSEETDLRGAPI